tara:strand:- start:594 stop:842 length:249 start_codon:yes stop_codon:yes gene_type:complete
MRRISMSLTEAINIVSSEMERSKHGLKRGVDRKKIDKALIEVEQAVYRYMRIENAFDSLTDNDELHGASSIVIEDDSVRAES